MNENKLIIFNKNSALSISEFMNLDLYDLEYNQIEIIKNEIVKNIKLDKLQDAIEKAILDLSRVGEPSLGADVKFIALDNQKRLNLICMLQDSLRNFRETTKNFKRNKLDCNNNSEAVFNYVLKLKEILQNVIDYGNFKIEEYNENMKYLNELERQRKLKEQENYILLENRGISDDK